ncbi:MAG: hypothetical protein HFG97_02635 [Dorea sp.]|nr:hypothetical protein [Dorea sp.]
MTNKIQDAFDNIKADPRLTESTKRYLSEKRRENPRPQHHPVMRLAVSAACAVFFMIMGAFGYSWVLEPVSYVSIDVNPSIELALNRSNRVISAAAYNIEGEEILEGLSLRWKKYSEAIHTVIESEGMSVYLSGEGELVLTVAADENHREELEEGVSRCAGHIGHDCHNENADLGTVSQAHELGLSLGKYNACLKLLQYDSSITMEDCKNMSMAEILIRLRKLGADDVTDDAGTDDVIKENPIKTGTDGSDQNENCRNRGEDNTPLRQRKGHHGH